MLLYVEQDIFQSPAQVIVNTVNIVGVMGKGIAKRYKEIYPDMYKQYRRFCEQKLLDIGKLWLYKTDTKWVLNFPTKKHWRNPSKLEYIELGLQKFVSTYEERGITSISFPQLGSGNGGLDWEKEVKPLMEKYLKELPIDVFIHIRNDKSGVAEHLNVDDTIEWLHNNPRSLSINQVWEDLINMIKSKNYSMADGSWMIEIVDNIDTIDLPVSVDYDDLDSVYILLKRDGYTIKLTQAAVYDIWLKLRDFGYLFDYDLPSEFQKNNDAEIIFNFLSGVDYVDGIYSENTGGSSAYGLTVNNNNLPTDRNKELEEVDLWHS